MKDLVFYEQWKLIDWPTQLGIVYIVLYIHHTIVYSGFGKFYGKQYFLAHSCS